MKRLRDVSIGQRLGAGFGLVLVALAIFGAVLAAWMAESSRAQSDYAQRVLPRADASVAVERGILEVAVAVRSYLLAPDARNAAKTLAAVEAGRRALEALARLPREQDGELVFPAVERSVAHYLTEVAAAASTGTAENPLAVEAALAAARAEAVSSLRRFGALQQQKSRDAIAAIEDSRRKVANGLVYAFAALALALVALGYLTTASIRTPARELTRVARELQHGNWQAALGFTRASLQRRGESVAPRSELSQIALAFGSAAEALERREQRLRGEARVAAAASGSLEKRSMATQALEAMAEATGAAMGAVYWRLPGTDELMPIATRALPAPAQPVRLGEGVPGQAADERRVVVLNDVPAERLKLGIDEVAPRSVVAVPAILRGDVLAVVVLGSLREFDAHAVEFLQSAGQQLAVGLGNVRAHEEVQRLLDEVREAHDRLQAQAEELQAQNEEIQAQSEELQAQSEELQAQNEELQERTEALAEADNHKNEFLGLLAHELRNPLAAISNSVFILGRGDNRQPGEAMGLAVIERQMRYLTRLIDDLLDVTRIARGKLDLHRAPLDLTRLAADCVHDCQAAARKSGLEVHLHGDGTPRYVAGDATRLAQVLGNLLANAIKFSEPGGRIDVVVRSDAAASEASVLVRDRGIGIDPALLQRLFQPFSQGDNDLARGRGGLGLGLALSKSLVQLHGGRIEARSEGKGRGAEFVVTLPLTAAPAESQAARAEARAAGSRRVLIVEDNADAAETLRMALELNGHVVDTAGGGLEGVDKAARMVPEFVFCDIGIPGIDGFEVARRLRADARLSGTRLIALSGYATPEDRRRSAAAGFDDHLAKPVTVDALLRVLDGEVTSPA
ncbi:MAG TPA: ATP-binding protein [Usitatibacter sp.]|nr:ATP-binding protein [Usitatibacter sp.]